MPMLWVVDSTAIPVTSVAGGSFSPTFDTLNTYCYEIVKIIPCDKHCTIGDDKEYVRVDC